MAIWGENDVNNTNPGEGFVKQGWANGAPVLSAVFNWWMNKVDQARNAFGSVYAAASSDGLAAGDIVEIADKSGLDFLDQVVQSANTGYNFIGSTRDWGQDGRFLFNRKGPASYVVETRSMEDLEPVSPAREFTMTGSSGSVNIMSNGDYLVAEHNSGEFDIWDLSDDSFVGSYTSVGTPFYSSFAFGKNNTLWIVTTTGANGTAYCIDLTTAAVLAGFTPLGLNFAQGANVVGFADDVGYYVCNDVASDDLESIDYTGTQIYTATGTGSGTTVEAITGDGNGFIYLINGAYIQKLDVSLQSAGSEGNLERLHLVSQQSVAKLVCDGAYIWNASDSDRIAIFGTRYLERVSLRDVTGQAGDLVLTDQVGRIEVDGMDLIYYYDDGGGNEGWRKVRGPNLSRRFQRRPGAWTGQAPLFNVLTPMER